LTIDCGKEWFAIASIRRSGAARCSGAGTPGRAAGRHVTSTNAKTVIASTSRVGAVGSVYGAPWPTTPVVTPVDIYVPASDLAPDPLTAADRCADFGTGCTAEQLCDLRPVGCPPPATDGFSAGQATGAQP
jgi:hypothetical protein